VGSSINEIVGMMKKIFDNVTMQQEVNVTVNSRLKSVESESNRMGMWIEEQRTAFAEILKSVGEINLTTQSAAEESGNIAHNSKKISELSTALDEIIQAKR